MNCASQWLQAGQQADRGSIPGDCGDSTVRYRVGTDSPHKKLKAPSTYEDQSVTLVNTQNVSVTKIVDSSSIQRAETKYGLRIQFLALLVMIHEVWLNA